MSTTRNWYSNYEPTRPTYNPWTTRSSKVDYSQMFTNITTSTIRSVWEAATSAMYVDLTTKTTTDPSLNSTVYSAFAPNGTNVTSAQEAMAKSDHFKNTMRILYIILAIIGIFGNLLVIFIVVWNRKMRTVTNVHILNLSLIDGIIMVCLFWRNNHHWDYSHFACKLYVIATSITDLAGCLQVAALSLDRWFAICFPLQSSRTRNMTNSILTCLFVWTVSAVIALPLIVQSDIRKDVCSIYWNDLKVMEFFYPFTFGFLIPITLISGSYLMILVKLKSLSFADKNSRRIRKVTIFVVIIIGVYLLLWLPYWFVVLFSTITEIEVPVTMTLVEYVSYLYSGLNPVLYAFVNDDFRKYMINFVTLKSFFRRDLTDEDTSTDGPGQSMNMPSSRTMERKL